VYTNQKIVELAPESRSFAMNHFIKSHFARKAAEASAQASASNIGSLPSASAANSAGASTNMTEISRTLDPLLNRLSDGGTSDKLSYVGQDAERQSS